MLYDPQRAVMSGDMPFSVFLEKARACRANEEVCTGLFGDRSTYLPGLFFEPLAGFHFGSCGPVCVPSNIQSEFYCDLPVITAIVILSGEWTTSVAGSPFITARKNMFMLSDWESVRGKSMAPAQEEYCHVAISIEKDAIGRHFGKKAGEEILQAVADALGGAPLIAGPASADVLSSAKQLLHMQKRGPLATIALRGPCSISSPAF